MPEYQYKGISEDGSSKKGIIYASSEEQAKDKLKANGLTVEVIDLTDGRRSFFAGRKVSDDKLCSFLRQYVYVMRTGMDRVNTIRVLSQQVEGKRFKRVLADMADEMNAGATFAESFRNHEEFFPEDLIKMVEAADPKDRIKDAFDQYVRRSESKLRLKSVSTSATFYPILVGFLMIAAVLSIMALIVPRFMMIFSGVDFTMSAFSGLVVNICMAVYKNGLLIILLIAAVLVIYFVLMQFRFGRSFRSSAKFSLGLCNDLYTKRAYAIILRNIAAFLYSGISTEEAIEAAAMMCKEEYTCFYYALLDAESYVNSGLSLSKALTKAGLFSELIIQTIQIGEELGTTAATLENVAVYYETETVKAAEKTRSIIEPAMTVIMIIVVGILLVALMQPVISLYDFVSTM